MMYNVKGKAGMRRKVYWDNGKKFLSAPLYCTTFEEAIREAKKLAKEKGTNRILWDEFRECYIRTIKGVTRIVSCTSPIHHTHLLTYKGNRWCSSLSS